MTDAYTPLEEAARAATPGPWKWEDWSRERNDTESPHHPRYLVNETPRGGEGVAADPPAVVAVTEDSTQWWDNPADATYIAAAHPHAVLGLIDKAREADRLRAALLDMTDLAASLILESDWQPPASTERRIAKARAALNPGGTNAP